MLWTRYVRSVGNCRMYRKFRHRFDSRYSFIKCLHLGRQFLDGNDILRYCKSISQTAQANFIPETHPQTPSLRTWQSWCVWLVDAPSGVAFCAPEWCALLPGKRPKSQMSRSRKWNGCRGWRLPGRSHAPSVVRSRTANSRARSPRGSGFAFGRIWNWPCTIWGRPKSRCKKSNEKIHFNLIHPALDCKILSYKI